MNFVKNKLVLRPLLASVAPVTLYSVGYGIAKVAGLVTFEYFAAIPWMCLAGVSLLYPVNHIGLSMLFGPADYILHKKLKIDHNPILQGNFLPVEHETSYEVMKVS